MASVARIALAAVLAMLLRLHREYPRITLNLREGQGGEQGQGAPGIYPALAGNRAVLLADPTNLVQSVLYGGFAPSTAGHPRPFGMPPFVLELEDRDIAAVLTHLRMALQAEGSKAGEVTPLQVNRIRAETTQ